MLQFQEALDIVLKHSYNLEKENVSLNNCLNRILAEDIISDMDMPPFDKSAVDGYACKAEDINMELEVIETVQAGQTPLKKIKKGQCTQIMTGAPVPDGADKIIMVEHVEINGNKIKAKKNQIKSNICKLAEDVKTGDVVLEKSILIKPQHIAVLASSGYNKVHVYKNPSVGVFSTGDELVEPDCKPSKSKIRNSNGPQLIAQVQNLGLEEKYYGIAKDTKKDTLNILKKALSENDIVLLTGGVSMGKFDFVPEVLKQAGVEILFSQIAIKPGKPTVFGTINNKFVFGLPGNPVSSFVLFEILVKALIYKLMGFEINPDKIKLPLGKDYIQKRTGRQSFIPVNIKNGQIFPVEYHGSAHINSLSLADGFISIPAGVDEIKKGELLDVRQI